MVGTAAPLRPGLTLWLWWVLANAVGEFAGLAASALAGALVALLGLLVGAIHGGLLVWLLRRQ